MDKIPVTFNYEGKTYNGFLNKVMGADSTSIFHLMIDNYYKGQLLYTDK